MAEQALAHSRSFAVLDLGARLRVSGKWPTARCISAGKDVQLKAGSLDLRRGEGRSTPNVPLARRKDSANLERH